jgi:hypothetical protein
MAGPRDQPEGKTLVELVGIINLLRWGLNLVSAESMSAQLWQVIGSLNAHVRTP